MPFTFQLTTRPLFVGGRYEIHDNGGRPFVVEVSDTPLSYIQRVTVYAGYWGRYSFDARNNRPYREGDRLRVYNARQVFVPPGEVFNDEGDIAPWADGLGNTILAELSHPVRPSRVDLLHRYVWIGNYGVQQFSTVLPITGYRSVIGNSNVPYPFAWSEQDVYLLPVGVRLSRQEMYRWMQWPYEAYYDRAIRDTLTQHPIEFQEIFPRPW